MKYRNKTAIYYFNPSDKLWHVSIRGMPELGVWTVTDNKELQRTVKEKLDAVLLPDLVPETIDAPKDKPVRKCYPVISKNGKKYYNSLAPRKQKQRIRDFATVNIKKDIWRKVIEYCKKKKVTVVSLVTIIVNNHIDQNPL